jgi:hypothetical protein
MARGVVGGFGVGDKPGCVVRRGAAGNVAHVELIWACVRERVLADSEE